MKEVIVEVRKHAGGTGAGVIWGEEPPMGRRWYVWREEEVGAMKALGARVKAIIRYPQGQLVYVFDEQDAIAHKGYEVRKAIEIDDAQRNGPLASLVDWARENKR